VLVVEVDEVASEVDEFAADVLAELLALEGVLHPALTSATTAINVAETPILLNHRPGGRTGALAVIARTILTELVERSVDSVSVASWVYVLIHLGAQSPGRSTLLVGHSSSAEQAGARGASTVACLGSNERELAGVRRRRCRWCCYGRGLGARGP
jgi:hypothetical protein